MFIMCYSDNEATTPVDTTLRSIILPKGGYGLLLINVVHSIEVARGSLVLSFGFWGVGFGEHFDDTLTTF